MGEPEKFEQNLTDYSPSIMGQGSCRRTAVLLPLIPGSGSEDAIGPEWEILFQRRAEHLDHQPGEICFPGGMLEPRDASPLEAARRETTEELNVPPDSIQIMGELDSMVMPWNLILYPFSGILRDPDSIRPDPAEVDSVFTVRLGTVLAAEPDRHTLHLKPEPGEDFPFGKIPGGEEYSWSEGTVPELFFEFDGEVVWGITARILNHFRDVLNEPSREST